MQQKRQRRTHRWIDGVHHVSHEIYVDVLCICVCVSRMYRDAAVLKCIDIENTRTSLHNKNLNQCLRKHILTGWMLYCTCVRVWIPGAQKHKASEWIM